jgi:hypothetical protein
MWWMAGESNRKGERVSGCGGKDIHTTKGRAVLRKEKAWASGRNEKGSVVSSGKRRLENEEKRRRLSL